MSSDSLKRAVFLDRDGTINIEVGYLHKCEDLRLIKNAGEGVALLNRYGFFVVVVTNQSGIGRGYYCEEELKSLHRCLDELLSKYDAHIDAYFYCPHTPFDDIKCHCRKPLPGMLFDASEKYFIDMASSFMIGDKRSDIDAGIAAGCRSILVRTGYGTEYEPKVEPLDNIIVADDLLAAAEAVVKSEQNKL